MIKNGLTKIQSYIGALALRERILILIIVLALSFGIWSFLLPGGDRTKLSTQIAVMEGQLNQLQEQINAIGKGEVVDPNAESRQQKATLQEQLRALQRQLQGYDKDLMSPAKTALVLKDLLSGDHDLHLLHLKRLPEQPVDEFLSDILVQTSVVLEFEGNYFSTLRYFQQAEKLPWRLFWDKLDYQVTTYPQAKITVQIHTLSEREQ